MNKLTQSEFFSKFGHAYIENVLTEKQCNEFTNMMYKFKNDNKLVNEINRKYLKVSYGGGNEQFEPLFESLTQRLEAELGIKMLPINTYARIYYNGGALYKHKDRVGFDYALSITLFDNLNKEWPLYCIDKFGNEVSINIKRGDGAMMLSTELEHWRDDLICEPDQHVVQLFMHWAFVKEKKSLM